MVTKPLNRPRQPLPSDPVTRDEEPAVEAGAEEGAQNVPPPEERAGPAWRVMFHISAGGQPRTIGLDIWRVTVLGRSDTQSAFRPDLDYTPYGAVRHGVSRRHSLIRPGERNLYLIDQNSTNGTWVNGQRLAPGRDFPLNDGDIVELGALRMTLRIVHSPQENGSGRGYDYNDDEGSSPPKFRFQR